MAHETTTTPRIKRNAAKLTIEEVRDVRRRVAAGESKRALAKALGVTTMAIHWVVTRRTWADID